MTAVLVCVDCTMTIEDEAKEYCADMHNICITDKDYSYYFTIEDVHEAFVAGATWMHKNISKTIENIL